MRLAKAAFSTGENFRSDCALHVPLAERDEACTVLLSSSRLRHTTVARPDGATATCGKPIRAPAAMVTGALQLPPAGRWDTSTTLRVPSQRDQATVALPAASAPIDGVCAPGADRSAKRLVTGRHVGAAPAGGATPKRRLTYREQQELDALPGRIDALEAEIAALAATLQDTAAYRQGGAGAAAQARLAAAQAELDAAYARWAALE